MALKTRSYLFLMQTVCYDTFKSLSISQQASSNEHNENLSPNNNNLRAGVMMQLQWYILFLHTCAISGLDQIIFEYNKAVICNKIPQNKGNSHNTI